MTNALNQSLKIGAMTLNNRIYRAPVLEGAGQVEDPASYLLKHFLPNAKAGVGLIVMGQLCITRQGRPFPGMLFASCEEDLTCLRPMTDGIRAEGTEIMLQLGHAGLYSIEAWHESHKDSSYLAPVPSVPNMRARARSGFVPYEVMSTKAVGDLAERYGLVARWAKAGGFSGVQIGACNGKVLHMFMSRQHNRRQDQYGGSVENRFRVLKEIREAIARECGPDYPVSLKYPAEELGNNRSRITLKEGIAFARLAEEAGYHALTPVKAGSYPNLVVARGEAGEEGFKHRKVKERVDEALGGPVQVGILRAGMQVLSRLYPYEDVWNASAFSAVKDAVSIAVFAVGGIRGAEVASGLVRDGLADVVGAGRPFYVEPDLAQRFLSWEDKGKVEAACVNCNACSIAQLTAMPGTCMNKKAFARRKENRLNAA